MKKLPGPAGRVAAVLWLAMAVSACDAGPNGSGLPVEPCAIPLLDAATPEAALQAWRVGTGIPIQHFQLGACLDGCWMAFSFEVSRPVDSIVLQRMLMLHVDNYLLDELDVYLYSCYQDTAGIVPLSVTQAGALRGPATVHLGYATWDVPLSLLPGRYDIIIFVRSAEVFTPVSILPLATYLTAVTSREIVFAGLYGAILAVTLAGAAVVLTRTDKPRAILCHMGFQLSYVAYQLSRDGVLSSLLWPGNAWMVHRAYLLMTGVSLAFLQLLTLDVLAPGSANPPVPTFRWLRLRTLQFIVPLAFMAGIAVVPDAALAFWQRGGRVLLIVILVAQLLISGRAIFQGEKYIRVHAAGLHIAVWGILVGATKAAGILPYAYFQYYALGGMVIESVFFIASVYLRISHLAAERARLEAGLKEANMALLQSRGRPHFLANTFTMIRSMMRGDPSGSESAFTLLVNDFRFFADNAASPLIALRDELAYIENYLAIMRLRFDEALVLTQVFDVVEADCMIPPLSLQPLVENSLHHATQSTDGMRMVDISLAVAGKTATFSAANDCNLPDTANFPPGTTHDNIMARMRYYHPDATLSLSVSGGRFIAVLRWTAL
jgi:hypothetical protein